MIWVVISTFLTVVFLIIALYNFFFKSRELLEERIEKSKYYGSIAEEEEDELKRLSFNERILRPLLNWLAIKIKRATPYNKKELFQERLILAGNPGKFSVDEFMALYYALIIIISVLALFLSIFNQSSWFFHLLALIAGAIIGKLLVDIFINLRIKGRQHLISRQLPDILDLLTISVEAGLGFDAAIQKVIEKFEGPISLEFNISLREMKMGKPRKDALRDLGKRTDVDDLNTFVSAIIQADQLGVSIANILRVQSEQMRNNRRQRIEEQAMKAPVKMLLPMVLFIFPAIFVILLGPAFIEIMETL